MSGDTSAVEPPHPGNRAGLARVLAYFDETADPLPAGELDWVQSHGLGILHAEVLRLRGVVARLEAGGR